MKNFKVYYRSRYHPMEGEKTIIVEDSPNKSWIRKNWHSIIETDEYTIKRIEEVK